MIVNNRFMNNSILPFLVLIFILLINCEKEKDNPDYGIFRDTRDNREYNWVLIGNQVWMAENLAYLPAVSPSSVGSDTIPYYYVYGYEGDNVEEAKASEHYSDYGVLYNWSAAIMNEKSSDSNPSGVQGICPDGWHLPSAAEWEQLVDFVTSEGYEDSVGIALKADNSWLPDGNGLDVYGFSAMGGGYRHTVADFYDSGARGYWWTATEYNDERSKYYYLFFYGTSINNSHFYKKGGFCIRCVRD